MRVSRPQRGSSPRILSTLLALSVIRNVGATSVLNQDEIPTPASGFSKRATKTHDTGPLPDDINPSHVFKNPFGTKEWNWSFEEHHPNNPSGNKDSDFGDDAFSFFVIDGTEGDVYSEFPDHWHVLHQHTEKFKLKKRAWDQVRRRDAEVPNDTFDPLEEEYQVVCPEGMNTASCKEIFTKGAENTIIKLPKGIGMGPYARVVSFEEDKDAKVDEEDMKILQKRQTIIQGPFSVFKMKTDFDFYALARNAPKDAKVQFRCDFSNLKKYWDETVKAAPTKRNVEKRWWGAFGDWLEKVTKMSESDEGNLEAKKSYDWKLLHQEKHCKTEHTEYGASIDLDATLDMGMHAHYSYLISGHLLPSPSIDDAYGFFSIEPFFKFLMTLEGHGNFEASSGDKSLLPFPVTFPGLSIKGLIRLGPELDVIGDIKAGLDIAGKVQAGFDIKFPKAQVAFPQNEDGKKKTEKGGAPTNNQVTTQIKPILNSEISAKGRVDITVTPRLKFGIKVLGSKSVPGGSLADGDVYLGVDNTIHVEVDADAKADIDTGVSAEVCYWADYTYRVFMGAKFSVLKYKWDADGDIVSNSEKPIEVLKKNCFKYDSNQGDSTLPPDIAGTIIAGDSGNDDSGDDNENTIPTGNVGDNINPPDGNRPPSDNNESNDIPMFIGRKRSEDNDLTRPVTAEGARAKKTRRHKVQAEISKRQNSAPLFSLDNLIKCPAEPPPDPNDDPCDPFSRDTPQVSNSLQARAGLPGQDVCKYPPPTLFYNCDYFPDTKYGPKSNPTQYSAIGICSNIRDGIEAKARANPRGNYDTTKRSAILHYKAGEDSNRKDACGKDTTSLGTTVGCARANREKFRDQNPDVMQRKPDLSEDEGYWLSCDEFPFNSSIEGGKGATTACVSQNQQYQQAGVQGLVSNIRYTYTNPGTNKAETLTYSQWSAKAKHGRYNIVLHYPQAGQDPPSNVGKVDPSSPKKMHQIIGAVNLWGNPNMKYGADGTGNNGVCWRYDDGRLRPEVHKTSQLKFREVKRCQVIFTAPKRAGTKLRRSDEAGGGEIDVNNPDTWEIEDVIIDEKDSLTHEEALLTLRGFEEMQANSTAYI